MLRMSGLYKLTVGVGGLYKRSKAAWLCKFEDKMGIHSRGLSIHFHEGSEGKQ